MGISYVLVVFLLLLLLPRLMSKPRGRVDWVRISRNVKEMSVRMGLRAEKEERWAWCSR